MKALLVLAAFLATMLLVRRPAPVPRGWLQAFYDEAVMG